MLSNGREISRWLHQYFKLPEGLCVQHNISLLAASLFIVHDNLTLKHQGHSCPKRKNVKFLLNSTAVPSAVLLLECRDTVKKMLIIMSAPKPDCLPTLSASITSAIFHLTLLLCNQSVRLYCITCHLLVTKLLGRIIGGTRAVRWPERR